jgi:ribosomal protein L11 methyltransferase
MNAAAEMLPDDTAAALFAEPDGRWAVELYFARRPDTTGLRDLVSQIAGEQAARALTVYAVAPRDWVTASLDGLRPVAAGRFMLHGRHDRARVAANRTAIEVEAALAFGTGHHGSTRGCLLALDALTKRRRKRPAIKRKRPARKRSDRGAPILDLGTGSGVLAMAAAKAFRLPVLASDIDRAAVNIARSNVRLNRTAPWIAVVHAAGLMAPSLRARAPYDFVFANILLAPLKLLAAPIARVLAPGARVILSGLLPRQANAAIAAYRAHGLALERRIHLDGWVTLVMARPGASS